MIFYISIALSIIGIIFIGVIIHKTKKNAKLASKKQKPKVGMFEKLKLFLTPITYQSWKRESLEKSFAMAMKTLNQFIRSKNFRYELPWYLMMGPEKSGKSTFLDSLLIESPIDEDPMFSRKLLCDWRFFNNGIFIDIKGSLVKSKDSPPISNEKDWFKILDLLKDNRPRKPLDGILLVISLEDFIGPNAKDEISLMQDAEYIYTKLWQMQRNLKIKLPIYFVITHMDKIRGFKEIIDNLPSQMQNEMFGWSVPYSPETLFKEEWVDEMFNSMNNRIEEIKGEIFVSKNSKDNANILLFSSEFAKIINPLKSYLYRIFQKNSYTEGYFLRGIYFTGSNHKSISITKENSEWPTMPGQEGSSSYQTQVRQVFTTDLVTKKILLEKNIARLVWQSSLSYSTSTKLIQSGIVALSTATIIGMLKANQELYKINTDLTPYLYRIKEVIKSQGDKRTNKKDSNLLKETELLLKTISDISSLQMKFVFLPPSWFSILEDKITELLKESYDFIILRSLSNKIEEKFQKLSKGILRTTCKTTKSFSNPLESKEFCSFKEYINKVLELETASNKLIQIKQSASLNDFAWVVKQILGLTLPGKFYKKADLYKNALQRSSFEVINSNVFKDSIRSEAKKRFQDFLSRSFSIKDIAIQLTHLEELMKNMQNNKLSFSSKNLHQLQQGISEAISLISSQRFDWLSHYAFQMDKFIKIISKISYSNILGEDLSVKFQAQASDKFISLRESLKNMQLPIVGPVFESGKSKIFEVSNKLLAFQGIVNSVFSYDFMEHKRFTNLQKPTPGKVLIWDTSILSEIIGIMKTYDEFLNNTVINFPPSLREIIKSAAKNSLERIVRYKLAKAQQFLFNETENIALLDEVQNIKLSFNFIAPILRKLGSLNLPSFMELKAIEKSRSLQILSKIDAMLESEGLYLLAENEINLENIINGMEYEPKGLEDYLSTQRNRVEYFMQEFVTPVIGLISLINKMEGSNANSITKKWQNINSDLNNYKLQNKLSKLENLESFIKENVGKINLKKLESLIKEVPELKTNKNDFFSHKLNSLKKTLANRTLKLISQSKNNSKNDAIDQFKQVSAYFPFNIDGYLAPMEAYNNLINSIKTQSKLIKLSESLGSKSFDYINSFLSKLQNTIPWLNFLNSPKDSLIIKFMPNESLTESMQRNIGFLLDIKITGMGTPISYPNLSQVTVSDEIKFEFTLATQSGVKFIQVSSEPTYSATDSKATFKYSRKEFAKMIFENSSYENNTIILRIMAPVMNAQGKEDYIIFAVPVSLIFQGSPLPFSQPQEINLPSKGESS